jgi:hypothetical protein
MSGGAHDFVRPPPAGIPPLLLHQISPWGGRSADVRWVRHGAADFFNRRGQVGADGEEAAVEERRGDGAAGGAGGWESVHRTTAAAQEMQRAARAGIDLRDLPQKQPVED